MLRVGQMVDGRWRVVSPLPSGGELLRWFGRQPETGEPVEILRPKTLVTLKRRRAIVAGFRAAKGDPAVVPIFHVGDKGVIVRKMPAERTLADLDTPFTAQTALALAGWLGPAVRALAPVLGGRLTKEDVILDARGSVQLAPGRRRDVVPEAQQESSLYALGSLLYEMVAGCAPEYPARPIKAYAPKVSREVEALITDLMSEDIVVARAALPARPGRPPILERSAVVRVASAHNQSSAMVTASQRPAYAVVIEPDSLGVVGRQRFSEALGVPSSAFDDFAWAGLPLPVASAQSAVDAEIWREEIARFRVEASVVHREPRFEGAWLIQASPLVLGACIALAVGLWPLALIAVLGAVALIGSRVVGERRERALVERAYDKLGDYDDARGEAMSDLLASETVHSLSRSSIHAITGGREEIRDALRDALMRQQSTDERARAQL